MSPCIRRPPTISAAPTLVRCCRLPTVRARSSWELRLCFEVTHLLARLTWIGAFAAAALFAQQPFPIPSSSFRVHYEQGLALRQRAKLVEAEEQFKAALKIDQQSMA